MILGIGIDIVELKRINQLLDKKGQTFIERILSEAEVALYEELSSQRRRLEFLAGRFAAKEAFAKAVKSGIGKLAFTDIEVVTSPSGSPVVFVEGYNEDKIHVSISHSEDYALAQIMIEK